MMYLNLHIQNFYLIPKKYHTKKLCKYALMIDSSIFIYMNINIYDICNNIIEKEIDDCIICASNKEYYISFSCNHLICSDCVKKITKCYYRCSENINFDTCFKNLNFNKVKDEP